MATSAADTSIKTLAFHDLWDHWPLEGRAALARSLGGAVGAGLAASEGDDSLVRLSAALHAAGHGVPAPAGGAFLADAQGRAYLDGAAQAEALLKKALGHPRPARSEADIAGRCGIVVYRGVAHGPMGEPLAHFDVWNGEKAADPTSDFWHVALHSGGVGLYEIKKA
jgi:hypothetical protein